MSTTSIRTSYNLPPSSFLFGTITTYPPVHILFAICCYLAMLSTQVHDNSALGLTMAAHVAGTQLFSGATSSIAANPANTAAIDPKKKTTCRRKRTNDTASDSAESSSQPLRTRDGPKKKKANRACFHCQKAHLTCDDCECPPRALASLIAPCVVSSLIGVRFGAVQEFRNGWGHWAACASS